MKLGDNKTITAWCGRTDLSCQSLRGLMFLLKLLENKPFTAKSLEFFSPLFVVVRTPAAKVYGAYVLTKVARKQTNHS